MVRRLLLPLLAVALLATEAAQAQTTAATPPARQAYRKAAKTQRVLSKREQQAAAAQARLQTAQAARDAAVAQAPAANPTSWSGWSNEPVPAEPTVAHRATNYNVSVAPGMPLNQVGHGVSTDYNGRPLAPAAASTTLPSVR